MASSPIAADRLVGGRYVLEAPLGKGSMGEVWRARHAVLKSPAAIKFLVGAPAASESARKRFLTEAQVAANLKSKHAVQVFDFGVTEDGLPYLVMELLEGETLGARIARQGRLSIEETGAVMRQAARALERAHALGIVHRDFKPENIVLTRDEEGGELAKVLDFGIAKIVGDLDFTRASSPPDSARPQGPDDGAPRITQAVGTPAYMAPEQVDDAAHVGPAADIWAFGVVAYECLTGARPFDDVSVMKLLSRILQGEPPMPASRRAPVPSLFDDWFRVACARDPAERFPDAATAASALLAALAVPGADAPALVSGPVSAPTAPSSMRTSSPMAATFGPALDDAPSGRGEQHSRPMLPQAPEVDELPAPVAAPTVKLPEAVIDAERGLRPSLDHNVSRTPAPVAHARALQSAGRWRLSAGVLSGAAILVTVLVLALRARRLPVPPASAGTVPSAVEIAPAAATTPPESASVVPPIAPTVDPVAPASSSAAPAVSATPPWRSPRRRSGAPATPSAFRLPPLGL